MFNFQSFLVLDLIYVGTMGNTNVHMLIWICVRIEDFLREVRITKKLSIIVLSRYIDGIYTISCLIMVRTSFQEFNENIVSYFSGPLREKAKRMFKLIDETPPVFSVYDMWRMDAQFLISMFQIVTSAYVILLQFAFL